MNECLNIRVNLANCPCTYPCDMRGKCCECVRNHRAHNELPACYFQPEIEKTYDRSIEKFLSLYKQQTNPLKNL
ncbi:MAG: DUF6485 family protein [Thermoproteota archaeon]